MYLKDEKLYTVTDTPPAIALCHPERREAKPNTVEGPRTRVRRQKLSKHFHHNPKQATPNYFRNKARPLTGKFLSSPLTVTILRNAM